MPRGQYPRPPILERFWSKVNKTEGCWIWTGSLIHAGYGDLWVNNREVRAHRFSYELIRGQIPEGMTLDHLCRNRACVNPDHLEVVSKGENVLRGIGITAMNARKEQCIWGHILTPENIYKPSSAKRGRRCLLCHQQYYQRTKTWRGK